MNEMMDVIACLGKFDQNQSMCSKVTSPCVRKLVQNQAMCSKVGTEPGHVFQGWYRIRPCVPWLVQNQAMCSKFILTKDLKQNLKLIVSKTLSAEKCGTQVSKKYFLFF